MASVCLYIELYLGLLFVSCNSLHLTQSNSFENATEICKAGNEVAIVGKPLESVLQEKIFERFSDSSVCFYVGLRKNVEHIEGISEMLSMRDIRYHKKSINPSICACAEAVEVEVDVVYVITGLCTKPGYYICQEQDSSSTNKKRVKRKNENDGISSDEDQSVIYDHRKFRILTAKQHGGPGGANGTGGGVPSINGTIFGNGTFGNGTFENGTFENGTFGNGTFGNGTVGKGTGDEMDPFDPDDDIDPTAEPDDDDDMDITTDSDDDSEPTIDSGGVTQSSEATSEATKATSEATKATSEATTPGCAPPTIENGSLKKNGTIERGKDAEVVCDTGYELAEGNKSTINCSDKGELSSVPICVKKLALLDKILDFVKKNIPLVAGAGGGVVALLLLICCCCCCKRKKPPAQATGTPLLPKEPGQQHQHGKSHRKSRPVAEPEPESFMPVDDPIEQFQPLETEDFEQ